MRVGSTYCKMMLNGTAKWIFLTMAMFAGVCHASDTLTICGAPLPPYSYIENTVPAGIDVDVAKEIFGQLKVPFVVDIEPFARCQLALKKGDADIGFAVSSVLDRRDYAYFPKNNVWQISYVFFTNKTTKQRYTIHGLEDAKRDNLRVGVVRGAAYNADFWNVFPGQDKTVNEGYNSALTPAADTVSNLRRLDLDSIQLFPQDRVAGLWAAKVSGGATPDYYDDVLFTKDYPNAFSKASKFSNAAYPDIVALMTAYDEKLAEFKKTDRYRALFTNASGSEAPSRP
jgi:ABC-type amino acid transport substrate-binding protein